MSVGYGTPATDIKYRGQEIGYICFNDHWSHGLRSKRVEGIRIRIKKKNPENNNWNWVTLKARPKDETEARAICQEFKSQILEIAYLERGL